MTRVQACLGGWCRERERCAHYVEADRYDEPAERLCPRDTTIPMLIKREKPAEPAEELRSPHEAAA
jgi:hypothetical protein